jgi:hypothetical protein
MLHDSADAAAADRINLLSYGIPYCGPFRGIKYLSSIWVPTLDHRDSYEFEAPDGSIEQRSFVTIDSGGHGTGTYGSIDMVLCNGRDVLIRKFGRAGESLFCEACFQVAARQTLEQHGLEDAISRVTDIVKKDRHAVGFVMEPFLNVDTVSHVFSELKDDLRPDLIASCLAQIALILWILETTLGLNHRDLKGDNILLSSKRSASRRIDISHCNIDVTVRSLIDVHIVDFGFACTGRGTIEGGSDVVASDYFPCTDPCPKRGRDMFQLCTFLYMSPRVRGRLGPALTRLFEKWLTLPGKDFPAFLRTKAETDTDWIYFLLSSSRFHADVCEPLSILLDIAAAFPNIVSIH